jgi:hypothetical protein
LCLGQATIQQLSNLNKIDRYEEDFIKELQVKVWCISPRSWNNDYERAAPYFDPHLKIDSDGQLRTNPLEKLIA